MLARIRLIEDPPIGCSRTTWTRDDDIGRSGAAQAEPGRGCAVPCRSGEQWRRDAHLSAGIVVHPAGNTSLVLSFSPLYRAIPVSISVRPRISLVLALFLPFRLSPSPSPSISLPLAFAIRVSSSSTSPLSRRSFFQYESTAMIPPIVSLDVRRSMVQKFGITVSTMFNRESTHNVECVGLVR